jgi:hypothetical protein
MWAPKVVYVECSTRHDIAVPTVFARSDIRNSVSYFTLTRNEYG